MLGMARDKVRDKVALPWIAFRKSPDSVMLTDAFMDNSLQIFYDHDGLCEAIEISTPLECSVNDISLEGQPYEQTKSKLYKFDSELDEDEAGLTSYVLGISLYAPSHVEHPHSLIESILVFKQGYYD